MPSSPVNRVAARQDPSAHRADLLAYARRMLGDEGRHAEDVVQEAYLRVTEQDAAGRRPDDDRRWLFRVVRNLALDERRRARHAAPLPDEAPAGPATGPADVLERREAAERTLQEVAALPPQQRRALVLDQAGLPTAEIARRMSTTENAVHQALFRARRRLRHARAAAWGIVPVPVARFMLRAGEARIPEAVMAAGTPGGGGRLLPVAGVMGAAVVGLIGGGTVVHELAEPPEVIRSEHTGRLSQATAPVVATARASRPSAPVAAPSARRTTPIRRVTTPAAPRVRPATVRTPVTSARAVRQAPQVVTRARAVPAPAATTPARTAATSDPAPAATTGASGTAGTHGRHDGRREHSGGRRRGDGDGSSGGRSRDGGGHATRSGGSHDVAARGGGSDDASRAGGDSHGERRHSGDGDGGGHATRRDGGGSGSRSGGRGDGHRRRGG